MKAISRQNPNQLFWLTQDFSISSVQCGVSRPAESSVTPESCRLLLLRGERTLDHCYTTLKISYKAQSRPSFGKSDHAAIFLMPVYKQMLKQEAPIQMEVASWTEQSVAALQDALDDADWDMFRRSSDDVKMFTEAVVGFIGKLADNTVQKNPIRTFPNQKPWVDKTIRDTLRSCSTAYNTGLDTGDMEEYKAASYSVRRAVKDANVYLHLSRIKTITGHKEPSSQAVGDQNQHSIQYTLPLTEAQVRMELRKIKARKAAGPDGISSRLLKTCVDQLCGILLYMFDLSLKLGKVPQIWKTSCVVPVPKTPRPKDFGDYRPVALTSHLMKTLERLVLTHLRPLVSPSMDPLQFAYQPGIGVEDAVIFLLNRAISHLEKAGSTVRVMFFDFSSAFNTIQPALLRDKMVYMGVDHHLSAWTLDYLTDRPQYVRTRDCESDMIVCNTGAPQGTVLAPFLFTIYTADFMFSSETCHLQKFSDDSAIVGLITNDDDREYRGLIKNFVDWCQRSCLQINAGKTKELVVDFCRNKQILSPVNIQGKDIVRVDSYKYLGVHLNNKLDWTDNTEAIYKKGQSRLFLLRRLRSFGVQEELLKTFFVSVVASAIFYGVVCWGSSISTADRKSLDKLIRKASSVLGIPLDTVQELGESHQFFGFPRIYLEAALLAPVHKVLYKSSVLPVIIIQITVFTLYTF
ncbi:hypothetical protein C0J45_19816 [Silurus meridionalis]|nr:hypothetical protein C0J45_19816 [Silurus meridionalis]